MLHNNAAAVCVTHYFAGCNADALLIILLIALQYWCCGANYFADYNIDAVLCVAYYFVDCNIVCYYFFADCNVVGALLIILLM